MLSLIQFPERGGNLRPIYAYLLRFCDVQYGMRHGFSTFSAKARSFYIRGFLNVALAKKFRPNLR